MATRLGKQTCWNWNQILTVSIFKKIFFLLSSKKCRQCCQDMPCLVNWLAANCRKVLADLGSQDLNCTEWSMLTAQARRGVEVSQRLGVLNWACLSHGSGPGWQANADRTNAVQCLWAVTQHCIETVMHLQYIPDEFVLLQCRGIIHLPRREGDVIRCYRSILTMVVIVANANYLPLESQLRCTGSHGHYLSFSWGNVFLSKDIVYPLNFASEKWSFGSLGSEALIYLIDSADKMSIKCPSSLWLLAKSNSFPLKATSSVIDS